MDVVKRDKPGAQHLVDAEAVAEPGAGVVPAAGAGAGRVERPLVPCRIPVSQPAQAASLARSSLANFAFRSRSRPSSVNAIAVRPIRVGRMQSNMSTPAFTAAMMSRGIPTPMRYRG